MITLPIKFYIKFLIKFCNIYKTVAIYIETMNKRYDTQLHGNYDDLHFLWWNSRYIEFHSVYISFLLTSPTLKYTLYL